MYDFLLGNNSKTVLAGKFEITLVVRGGCTGGPDVNCVGRSNPHLAAVGGVRRWRHRRRRRGQQIG